jgi:hypothetical protein
MLTSRSLGFLSLPYEIREQIYSYLVPKNSTYSIGLTGHAEILVKDLIRDDDDGCGDAGRVHQTTAQTSAQIHSGPATPPAYDNENPMFFSSASKWPLFPIPGLDKLGVRLLHHHGDDCRPIFRFSAKNMMRTTRQIHAEISQLLYTTNEFNFLRGYEDGSSSQAMTLFFNLIGPSNTARIRFVTIHTHAETMFNPTIWKGTLRSFRRLVALQWVRVIPEYWDSIDPFASDHRPVAPGIRIGVLEGLKELVEHGLVSTDSIGGGGNWATERKVDWEACGRDRWKSAYHLGREAHDTEDGGELKAKGIFEDGYLIKVRALPP